jgi:pyruvate formate lyase activating enzyme
MTSGLILNVQRLSTEDGPGIRSTVFFKGCPLRCTWCHNPESISPCVQIQWFKVRCLRCRSCVENCPFNCLSLIDNDLVINRGHCDACGKCVDACPSGALELIGKTIDVPDLLVELLKDKVYYDKSGGGVTLSGGEPTLQPEFAESLLRGLKENGISTAIDTCGLTPPATFQKLMPYTDLVLFDLKLFDPFLHQKHTGANNQKIHKNLSLLGDYSQMHPHQIEIWVRTPIIPGATASEENISALAYYLREMFNDCISRWELCAFNNLCRDQYQRLGMDWIFAQTPLLTSNDLAHWVEIVKRTGFRSDLVIATGATRVI